MNFQSFHLTLLITVALLLPAVPMTADSLPIATNKQLIIVLSPHIDDAVFSLGGSLAQAAAEKIVVTFFAGIPSQKQRLTWWDKACGFKSSREAAGKRLEENRSALATLGIDENHAKNYPYLDAQYRYRNGKFLKENRALKAKVVKNIQALIAGYPNRQIAVYGPILDYMPNGWGHIDHEIVHDALLDVARASKNEKVTFYFYEDFINYQQQFKKHSRLPLQSYIELKHKLKLERTVIPLSEADFNAQFRSIDRYPSQLRGFEQEGIMLEKIREQLRTHFPDSCVNLGVTSYSCEVVYKIKI